MIDRAGLVGEDGTSHQGMFTLAAQRSVPHLVIGSPKDEQELRDMVVTAFVHAGPISIHYPRDPGEDLPDRTGRALTIGQGEVLTEGSDLLLVGFGPIVQRLISAADILRREDGLTATVINARWAKPLDEVLIARHAGDKRLVVTAEESAAPGGFGDGVLDGLNRADVRVPLLKVALAEGFVHHGAVDDLRRQQRIDVAGHRRADPRRARRGDRGHRGRRDLCRLSVASGTAGSRVRVDQLLVDRGLAASRAAAQALVLAGAVEVAGQPGRRLTAGQRLAANAELLVHEGPRWASRGGDKLAAALAAFAVSPAGLVCLDAGASTGGFTDVLLAGGARRVYAVDVGRGQLAARLAGDPRVTVRDRTNLRTLSRTARAH